MKSKNFPKIRNRDIVSRRKQNKFSIAPGHDVPAAENIYRFLLCN